MRKPFHALILVGHLATALGCTHMFFQPDRIHHTPRIAEHVLLYEGFIPTPDGQQLHYWYLPAQLRKVAMSRAKGLIVQLHGNAENLSSHVMNLAWVLMAGYDLVIFDYRGYGRSTGSRDLDGAHHDVASALDFMSQKAQGCPLIFYGQSLGGTLLLRTLADHPHRWPVDAVVVESSFYSYRQIAREKLASAWLTWPFQWLGYLLVTDKYSLGGGRLRAIAPTPVWLFYSEDDRVVPIHNGRRIYEELAEPKKFVTFPEPGHISAMWVEGGRYRDLLLQDIQRVVGPDRTCPRGLFSSASYPQ